MRRLLAPAVQVNIGKNQVITQAAGDAVADGRPADSGGWSEAADGGQGDDG